MFKDQGRVKHNWGLEGNFNKSGNGCSSLTVQDSKMRGEGGKCSGSINKALNTYCTIRICDMKTGRGKLPLLEAGAVAKRQGSVNKF